MSLRSMCRRRPSSAWLNGPSSSSATSTRKWYLRMPSAASASLTSRSPASAAWPSSQLGRRCRRAGASIPLVIPTSLCYTVGMTKDRVAVADLVTRLYALLDERRYDELGSVYAPDVELEFPSAHMHGLDEAVTMARSRGERYDRAQHITTDLLVDVEGDGARVRANHWAIHVHPGGRFEAGAGPHLHTAPPPARGGLAPGRGGGVRGPR